MHSNPLRRPAAQYLAQPLEPRVLLSTAQLVKDINLTDLTTETQALFAANGKLFFRVGYSENQLPPGIWSTDGTAEGTQRVVPFAKADALHDQVAAGDRVFVSAGGKIWLSGGSVADTHVVKDFLADASNPTRVIEMEAVGSDLFFVTRSENDGVFLWKSDGTEAGTVPLRRFRLSRAPGGLQEIDGALYYRLPSDRHGKMDQLWKSDGTVLGTTRVANLSFFDGAEAFYGLTQAGDNLFFLATTAANGSSLWKVAGGRRHAFMVKDTTPGPDGASIFSLTASDGKLLFLINPKHGPVQLWNSEGTESGTMLLKEITGRSAFGSDRPYFISTDIPGIEYFRARGGLWRTDGTAEGTYKIAGSDAALLGAASFKGDLYFSVFSEPERLFKTDGTVTGTTLVSTPLPEAEASFIMNYVPLGDTLYFNVLGTIWRTDGTPEGTGAATDLLSGRTPFTDDSDPSYLAEFDGDLYFSAFDGVYGDELWRSDGTDDGTFMIKDFAPGFASSSPRDFTEFQGELYFFTQINERHELWKTDGSAGQTVKLADLGPAGRYQGGPDDFGAAGGLLFFHVDGPSTDERSQIWVTDGTADGTRMLTTIKPGWDPLQFTPFVAVGDNVYFSAADADHGYELWRSDGTPEGTILLKDIRAGVEWGDPNQLMEKDGLLYFFANDGMHGDQLWRSDGTTAGTVAVTRLPDPTGFGVFPYDFTRAGNLFYFSTFSTMPGSIGELWKTDGTRRGTRMVRSFSDGHIEQLEAVGEDIYFVKDNFSSLTLWKSDGTSKGTHPIITQGQYAIDHLTAAGGKLYFSGTDRQAGEELWVTDGTVAGTMRLTDIAPGRRSSFPDELRAVGQNLFFTAYDGVHGMELFKLEFEVSSV